MDWQVLQKVFQVDAVGQTFGERWGERGWMKDLVENGEEGWGERGEIKK